MFFYISPTIASHEGSPRREEVPLSRVRLQMQVGDSAEVPHDQAHRYQQDITVDDYNTWVLLNAQCTRTMIVWP